MQRTMRLCIIFANLKPGQTQVLSGRRWIWGRKRVCFCFVFR